MTLIEGSSSTNREKLDHLRKIPIRFCLHKISMTFIEGSTLRYEHEPDRLRKIHRSILFVRNLDDIY
jgi:hypothetical protein